MMDWWAHSFGALKPLTALTKARALFNVTWIVFVRMEKKGTYTNIGLGVSIFLDNYIFGWTIPSGIYISPFTEDFRHRKCSFIIWMFV